MSLPISSAITCYEIPWLELDWPIDWGSFFFRSSPLILEIGFGNGGFLIDQASSHPDRNYIGIERSWGSLQRLFKGLHKQRIENVRVLQCGASLAIEHLYEPESISEVYINFSDPWPKERHHGRRLIQPDFIARLASRLTPDGRTTIATDHAEYAEWIRDVLEGQNAMRSVFPTTSVSHLEGRQPTKYELKATKQGTPIHYFVWKREGSVSGNATESRIEEMPNVILKGAFSEDRLLAREFPVAWQGTDKDVNVVVKLTGTYTGPEGSRLVEAMAREGEFSQHFGVLVSRHTDGDLLIKLSSMGHPRPTFGVKQAVRMVSRLVLESYPNMRIRSSTVEDIAEAS